MLKRLVFFIAIVALSSTGSAKASPETAENWGAEASALYQTTADLLGTIETSTSRQAEADYIDGLANFSVVAGRLAVWVDTSGGAKDFGCIYRGMAEEAELQLEALELAETPADAKAALKRIATMLDDAQAIATASAHAARTGISTAPAGHCAASTLSLDTYLGRGS